MLRSITLFALAVPLLIGCGGDPKGSLSGAVTIDGKRLKRGTVRLEPDGGQGTPAGGDVRDGRYEIHGIKPGKYTLHVDGEPETSGPVSQEEVMKRSEEAHKAATQNPVPAGATGNDQAVEVTGAAQTLDVKLESPGSRKK